ncbi:abortive infection family protein [Solirubrobacter sp. CPCC 204708]|uniref:Abortive infection family protein n=1 Tax=Solirubrobacter deserti TaxID=2282478 RepID=A0ABT4RLF9_9ACTN|nr:abortive infection family protein [Solirubrobacter deserti]MBE2320402.1 abortive infection family protein [Solirubrobacter deserti]MDA0139403.1 abortive infection family protein [Solirubrobacter deserti]
MGYIADPNDSAPEKQKAGASDARRDGLSLREVTKVVNQYIGVSGGYLGDFSYRSHADFYPEFCDLDVDPYRYEGTTRERFIEILSTRHPIDQAKILRGVLERFPVGASDSPPQRERVGAEMLEWIRRLESGAAVSALTPSVTRDVVLHALADAESLVRAGRPTSAVDRVHTALHGHLLALCEAGGVVTPPDASMTAIFKALRRGHPQLQDLGPRSQDIEKVLNAASAIFDALGPLRNRASVAHPNLELLGQPEAMLVVNVGYSLLNYLSAKLETEP